MGDVFFLPAELPPNTSAPGVEDLRAPVRREARRWGRPRSERREHSREVSMEVFG